MRVLVIADESRTARVNEGLAGVHPLEVRSSVCFDEMEAAAFAPDVVVIACEKPDRETLESLRGASPRPVVMFVDCPEPALAEAAVHAGVSAYVVDGLAPARAASVLEVAITRFRLTQALRKDLAKAQADLAARKMVERAKGLLMKERGLDEEAAYRLLRKLAMDNGRPIGTLAAELVAYAELLKGGGR